MAEEIPLLIDLTICPVTSFPNQDRDRSKMIRELALCIPIKIIRSWKINDAMMEHCQEYNTMLIVEVSNFTPDLTPSQAVRTSRVLSITEKQFGEFFVDVEFKPCEYLFVKQEVFESITQKYFK